MEDQDTIAGQDGFIAAGFIGDHAFTEGGYIVGLFIEEFITVSRDFIGVSEAWDSLLQV